MAAPTADPFTQMVSLFTYMQRHDETLRAAAREEARLANDRYKADVELMMERDRLASRERIAQIEATARTAGRAVGAGELDAELLAQRIGEVVGAKLEEVYESEDDAPPAPASDASHLATIAGFLQNLGPVLPHLLQLFQGNGPPVGNPAPPTSGNGGTNGVH
jgi:hypothetical protein